MAAQHDEVEDGRRLAPVTGNGLATRDDRLRTLERARATLRLSHDLYARSVASLARAETLAEASDAVRQQALELREQLQLSVTTFVRELRDEGIPPEIMLAQVKATVREAIPPGFEAREARALMDTAVKWSIDAYFHAA